VDRLDEQRGAGVLEEEAARPVAERGVDVLVEVERGDDDDPGRRGDPGAGEQAQRLQTVHAGHADVEQQHVRAGPAGQGDRLDPVGGLADEFHVRLGTDDHAEARAYHRLVIGHKHPDAHAAPFSGIRTSTAQPRPIAGPARWLRSPTICPLVGGVRVAGGTAAVVDLATLQASPLDSSALVDPSDLDRMGAPAGVTGLIANAAQGGESGRTAARKALQAIIAGDAGNRVEVLADQRDEMNAQIDALLGIALGLVGLTVLIAVVGVGSTTALSVVERIREAGLLRALGLSRGGLRAMLTTEAALYGTIGAFLGLLLGLPYAWLFIAALGEAVPVEWPAGQLALAVLGLAGLSALAGVLPAWRTAKVSPMAAIAQDG